MRLQTQARGAAQHLKKHAFAGVNQTGAAGKRAADTAVIEDVEHLAVAGPVVVDQIDADLAVQGRLTRDIDLVVKRRTRARGGATDFEQGGRT